MELYPLLDSIRDLRKPDYQSFVRDLFASVGITINGSHPWDPSIHDDRFYGRLIRDGSLGLGESYVDGWWDCERVDEMMARLAGPEMAKAFRRSPSVLYYKARATLLNEGDRKNARYGVQYHYDIGNDLYQVMLDERMVYTCAYWAEADNLADAQVDKMELVCRKLQLEPGMRVLDIGCGWGSFAKYAAENYGVSVVGITISKEQASLARQICEGLPVEIRMHDYRETTGSFDRILSLGMFEHVTYKNHRAYMDVVHRCLADDGLQLLHTIGRSDTVKRGNDLFINRYIFPNTSAPSPAQIGKAIDGQFVLEDWENFGPYYDKTLAAWYDNFKAGWPELQQKYGDRFFRLWHYYLHIAMGWFRARRLQLWQIVLSKNGLPGGYRYQQERTHLGLRSLPASDRAV